MKLRLERRESAEVLKTITIEIDLKRGTLAKFLFADSKVNDCLSHYCFGVFQVKYKRINEVQVFFV